MDGIDLFICELMGWSWIWIIDNRALPIMDCAFFRGPFDFGSCWKGFAAYLAATRIFCVHDFRHFLVAPFGYLISHYKEIIRQIHPKINKRKQLSLKMFADSGNPSIPYPSGLQE